MAQEITLGPSKVVTPWQAEWKKTITSLNAYQQGNLREVVYGKNPTQNARMLAAAGAGKTRTLIAILAEALGKGILRPEETVTTTFTRMAGAEMRERLRAHVDPAVYQRLEWGKRVATFHSIAMSWLKRNDPNPPPHGWSKYNLDAKRGEDDKDSGGGKSEVPEFEDDLIAGLGDFLLVIDSASRWMKDKDKERAQDYGNRFRYLSRLSPGDERRGLAEELWPEMAKLAAYYDKRETTRSLFMKICSDWPVPGTASRGLNLPDKAPAPGEYGQVVDIIRSRGLRRMDPEAQDLIADYMDDGFQQLDAVWQLYDEAKVGLGAFDYADALQAFYNKMNQGAKLVMVDEFQDQTLIQINIGLKLARNGGGKLVLIGDTRQAIYAFRGADIEYAIHTDQPPVSAITLEIPTNYRSGRMIVETGNEVCKGAFWSIGEPAIPARRDKDAAGGLFRPDGIVDVTGYGDAEEEASAAATYIAEKYRAGSRLGDFAILCRGRAAMAEYEVALLRERLPVIIVGVDAPFFSRKDPKNILRLLMAAAETPYGTSVPTQALVRSKRWSAGSPIEALLPVYKRGDAAGFKYMQSEAFTGALQAAYMVQPDVVKALRLVLGQTYQTPKKQTKAFRDWKPAIDRLIADIERIRAGKTWAEQVQLAAAAMLSPGLRAKLRGDWLAPYRAATGEKGPAEPKIEVPAPQPTPGQPPKADPTALLADEEEMAAAVEMFASTASRYENLESLLSLAASMDDRALGEGQATGGTVHAGDIGNKEGRALDEIREAMKNRVTISTVHGCVSPNTLIETPHGLLRISEAAETGEVATSQGTLPYTRKFVYEDAPMLRIRTRRGYELEVTRNHGMYVWRRDDGDYVRLDADRLVEGDFLRLRLGLTTEPVVVPSLPAAPPAMDPRTVRHPIPTILTPELAEFFGLMVADGTLYKRGFRLVKKHADVIERFAALVKSLFGYEPKHVDGHGCFGYEVSSTYIADWLRSVGGMDPKHKAIPTCILRAPLHLQADFLRGLFEDGTVNIKPREDGTFRVDHVAWSTKMEQMSKDVHTMLLRFGIVSTRLHVRHKHAGKENWSWRIALYGQDARRFRDQINFVAQVKRDRLAEGDYADETQQNAIPVVWHDERLRADPWAWQNGNSKGYIGRHTARKLGGFEAELDFYHDRIDSIEEMIGPSMCLEVPNADRFLQNGFDGGNSKGLEFQTVFVSCTGNVFPSMRGDYEEERRLAYVAFTRAENELHVTYWGAPPPPNKPFQKGGPSPFVRYVGALLSRVEQKIPFFYDVEPMLRSAAPHGWHLASGRTTLEATPPAVEWKSPTGKFVTLTARYVGGSSAGLQWTAVSEAGLLGDPVTRFEDAVLASAKYMLGQRAHSPEGEMDMDSYIAFAFSRGDEPTGHGLTWAEFALWLTQHRSEMEPTVQRTLADLSASRGAERLLA